MTTVLVRCSQEGREALHQAAQVAARHAIRNAYRIAHEEVALESITIEKDALGKPHGRIPGEQAPIALSISHSFPFALATATTMDNTELGTDIERIRDFAHNTWEAFLTPAEKKKIAHAKQEDRMYLSTLYWSLKESALKALGVGLRIHPRDVDMSRVTIEGGGPVHTIRIQGISLKAEVRFWRVDPDFVATRIAFLHSPRIIDLVRQYGTT